MLIFFHLLFWAAAAGTTPAAAAAASPAQAFHADVDRFVSSYLRLLPERATRLGDHRFDDDVADLSARGMQSRANNASMWIAKFSLYDPAALSPHDEADREWLISTLRSEILEVNGIRRYQKDPGLYLPTSGIFALIERDFAPLADRMGSVARRETAALANLEAARDNLAAARTPKIAIDITLQQMPATISFFQENLPKVFASVPDGAPRRAFAAANTKLVKAIESYSTWLKDDLEPRASGSFAIGADNFRRMVEDDDMVDTPLPQLEEIGEAELARLQAEYRKTAASIDPSQPAAQLAAALAADHPAAGQVIPTVASELSALRDFVETHHLVTLPSRDLPEVRETPPFMRATIFASTDAPGPFERTEKAWFDVALPDPTWPAERQAQLLEFFNPYLLSDVEVHEAFPGHFTQFLINRQNPDKVRAIFVCGSNAEGWALYCEQMMLDEGWQNHAPRHRLAQLEGALIRACRYLVAIRMHTRGMSLDAAAKFFENNAYMNAGNAMVEARRGTEDPGYLRYQLGKLMILKLRAGVQAREGSAFNLGRFHDAFLAEGAIPIKLIRRDMLGSDGPLF